MPFLTCTHSSVQRQFVAILALALEAADDVETLSVSAQAPLSRTLVHI